MAHGSVSLQLHGRARKRRARVGAGGWSGATTSRVLIPFLSLHILPGVSMALGKGDAPNLQDPPRGVPRDSARRS